MANWLRLFVGLSILGMVGCRHSDVVTGALPLKLPPTILWAWERPENLEFIDTAKIGVAFFAETIILEEGSVRIVKRVNQIKFAAGTKVMPVIRIEIHGVAKAQLDSSQCASTANAIMSFVTMLRTDKIQLDFDARQSDRDWYKHLLLSLRAKLPSETKISITALASWCMHDAWIDSLPIDEAVPMLFRLGIAQKSVTEYLRAGGGFTSKKAVGCLGISTDELLDALPSHERLYIFSNRTWTKALLDSTLDHYHAQP
jgi:hypothetical protein